ncbi:hypothetical protein J7I98_08040 [Streptomyces sp. ISL-98]|nr:hypothetical protein [Streptomyces sp. ISL-98]MBT2505853.1 hypothetical protein [Streptomyces sp. ISL-98]
MMLRPVLEPMLAQARETVPGPGVLPGGLAFEAKFDGSPDPLGVSHSDAR